jgi:two-component system sensor histidine kinase KdpD
LPRPDGHLEPAEAGSPSDAREAAVAQWAFDHGRPAGLGTDTLPAAALVYVPLRSAQAPLGVLGVRPAESLLPLTHDSLDLLEGLARLAASGVERVRLAEESAEARLTVEAARMRDTLLSAVSNDLRTPLATITRAASSLLTSDSEPARERALKERIRDEAERVRRLVANLLDMTRPD